MNPHANRRIGLILLLLGLAALGHGLLGCLRLAGVWVAGTVPPGFAPLLLWVGLSFGAVGIAYQRGSATVFGKRADGTLPLGRLLLLLPFHVLNRIGLGAQRLTQRFPLYHKVAPGLYLGGAPFPADAARLQREGVTATLDLTSEFTETPALRQRAYRCIPLLDATAPTLDELRGGAEWIHGQRQDGKDVYVHCAKGVGRSATVAAAYLILSGQARTADEAVKQLQATRTRVHLTGAQAQALSRFADKLRADSEAVK